MIPPNILRLSLIRHGQTEWNKTGRYTGQSDIPLTDLGIEQAEEVAAELKPRKISAIYSSDLIRSQDTAAPIAREHELEVHCDARLREIDQGVWEGMFFDDIKKEFAKEFKKREKDPINVAPPGGESVGLVRTRVLAALEDIRLKHSAGEEVVIVSHGLSIALLRVHFGEQAIESVWDYIPSNVEIVTIDLECK